MKDIKILVATHKQYRMPEDDIYLPLHVGREGKEDLGYQGDNEGENISLKNPNYCELTGLYWAWKNLKVEYIGLSHYRRHFSNKASKSSKKDKFESIITHEELDSLLDEYDIILPKKRNYYIETIWSHYKNAHHIKDLEEVKKIVNEKYPHYNQSFDRVMKGSSLHLYNMFVMKKDEFDNYCAWLFDILFELEIRVDISGYDNYQKRIFGFISERLFNVWLFHQKEKVNYLELRALNMENISIVKKSFNFMKRKLG